MELGPDRMDNWSSSGWRKDVKEGGICGFEALLGNTIWTKYSQAWITTGKAG